VDQIIIIGGKGTALNIAEQIVDASVRHRASISLLGFALDDPALGHEIDGFPLLCRPCDLLASFPGPDVKFLFALYKPERMRERVELLRTYGIPKERFATFVHPLAFVGRTARVGCGSVIFAHASVLNRAAIQDFSIVNSHVVVEHDARIGSSCFIAASAVIGARATLGSGTFVGLGSTVREDVSVGEYAFVGMGSNVLSDVGPNTLVYGNPARPR
jgi:sugar O-acyltransferase (sialic acid O-acetyltransferase NeuD family)